jgi:hypothetical protein
MSQTLKQLEEKLRKLKLKDLIPEKVLEDFGRDQVDFIKSEMEKGFGTGKNGEQIKYKENKKETIKERKRLAEIGKLSIKTKPELSNQIRSEKMYNSIKYEYNLEKLEIYFDDEEVKKYAKAQAKMKGETLKLRKDELKKLKREIAEAVIQELELYL